MASIAPQISIARRRASTGRQRVGAVRAQPPRQASAWRELIIGDGPLFIRLLRWGQRHRG